MPDLNYKLKVTGDDVARVFGEIARAAETSQAKIAAANRRTEATLKATSAAMKDVRIAAESFTTSLGPAGSALSALGGTGAAGAVALGLGAVTVALTAATKAAIATGAALHDQSERIGLNVKVLQEYQFAARQSGVSTDALQTSLQIFVRNVGQAQVGTGSLVKALKDSDAGFLKTVQSAGSTEEALDLVVKKISEAGSGFEKARLLQAAFGRGAAELLPLFSDGAKGLAKMREEFDRLGVGIPEGLINSADRADDALAKLGDTIKGNVTTVLLELAPIIEHVANNWAAWVAIAAKPIRVLLEGEDIGDLERRQRQQLEDIRKSGSPDQLADAERQLRQARASQGLEDDAKRAQERLNRGATKATAASAALDQAREARAKASDDPQVKLEAFKQAKAEELRVVQTAEETGVLTHEQATEERKKIDAHYALEKKGLLDKSNTDEKREAARTAADIASFQKRARDQARAAESAGLTGEAEIAARSKATKEAFAEDVRSRIKDEKEAAKIIADFNIAEDARASKEIAETRQKAEKKATDDAAKLAGELADVRRKGALAGLVGIDKIREEAKQEIEVFEETVKEKVKDANEAAHLIADFRRDVEAKADKDIAEFKEKEAAKAKSEAEKAAREAEKTLKPFQDAAENIAADLSSALVDSFVRGEDQAKDTADVIKDVFANLAETLLQTFIQKNFLEPIMQQLSGATQGQGGGIMGFLGSLLGGGGTAAAGGGFNIPGVTSLAAGVQGPTVPTSQAAPFFTPERAASGATSLAGGAGTATGSELLSSVASDPASSAVALAAASKSLIDNRKSFDAVTLGTGQAEKNRMTGISAGLIAGFAGGGAAIGSVVPIIGTAAGAAIGAAIGAAASNAISQGVNKGISSGVSGGLTQKQLEDKVVKNLEDDIVLTIINPMDRLFKELGLPTIASVLGPSLTPSIDVIFAKMFRQVLGAEGLGLSTEGLDVRARGKPLGAGVGRDISLASRIIAEGFGAGGAAFGEQRQLRFDAILRGGVRRRAERQGLEAGLVLAQAFVTAFGGQFMETLKAAAKTGPARRQQDFGFVAKEFSKAAPSFGFDFGKVTKLVQEEEFIPGKKAVAKSREAFAQGLQDALANAGDSDAFRKSLTNSVEKAFLDGTSKALVSGPLGEVFATFFSVSNISKKGLERTRREGTPAEIAEAEARGLFNRRDLRRARRRGDTEEEVTILSREFQADVKGFTELVNDPAFIKALAAMNDELLRLRVSAAIAAGDIAGAADAIEARLAPQIQFLKDAIQLGRDVRTRVALATAGPGFAGEQAQVEELTRTRQEVETRFVARFGASIDDFRKLLTGDFPKTFAVFTDPGSAGIVAADKALQENPKRVLAAYQEFADARLAELEGEVALAREQVQFFKQVEDSFKSMSKQASAALREGGGATDFAETLAKTFGDTFAASKMTPESIATLQQSLSEAIGEAASRAEGFKTLKKNFDSIQRAISATLGTDTGKERLAELKDNLDNIVDPTDLGQMGDAAADLAEGVQIATARFQAFSAAIETFSSMVEGIEITLGRLSQGDVFAKRQADIQKFLPKALGGDVQAMADIQKPLGEAIANATQRREFFKTASEGFGTFAQEIGAARGGRRGQRGLLAQRQDEIQRLMAQARAGGPDAQEAIQKLQALLPSVAALGGQVLRGGRLRALQGALEMSGRELEDLTKDQVSVAEKQLTELEEIAKQLGVVAEAEREQAKADLEGFFSKAGALGTVAEGQRTVAMASLVTLRQIADALVTAAATEGGTAKSKLDQALEDLSAFKTAVQPVIDYLTAQAGATLDADLNKIAELLGPGPNNEIATAVREVRDRLPVRALASGGYLASGEVAWVGERGPEILFSKTNALVVPPHALQPGHAAAPVLVNIALTVNAPTGMRLAEAHEFGRSIEDPIERAVHRGTQRALTQLRKVA